MITYQPQPMEGPRRGRPENMTFTDDGCAVHPRCLECPLPLCVYDTGEGPNQRKSRTLARDQEIYQLSRAGWSNDQIAERFAISKRSAFRVVSEQIKANRKAA